MVTAPEETVHPDPARELAFFPLAALIRPEHSRPDLAEPQPLLEPELPRQLRDARRPQGGATVAGPGLARWVRAPGSCLSTGKQNLPSEITKSWEVQESR